MHLKRENGSTQQKQAHLKYDKVSLCVAHSVVVSTAPFFFFLVDTHIKWEKAIKYTICNKNEKHNK